MSTNKNTIYLFGILFVLLVGGIFFFGSGSGKGIPNNTENFAGSSGDVQKVVIGMKNYNYYPNTITVKAGQPVSITLDSSVFGCYRSFTIRELGVAKYLPTPKDSVEFTPTKKGTYTFACSMGMGTGKLVVE